MAVWFRSAQQDFFYPEPPGRDCACPYEAVFYATRDGGQADGPAGESGDA